jgi:ADP-ribosylation factor-like protein 2
MLVGLTQEGPGDVGGQKTLRSYWRNYFEKTDALIWVVDSTDRLRIQDCRDELKGLLQEEVSTRFWSQT